ncbi:MAG: MBL fold metallo-hydrolase [Clostridiaceae bacterium]|nr:MBL fold metallo-hydrolase [Clostridiaceae bacterium]
MEKLSVTILQYRVPNNRVAVFYLGQAGFVFKTPDGVLTVVDPYLTNCCERFFGFKRLMPFMLDPTELSFDVVLATHAHYDHFDIDAMPALLSSERTRLIAAEDCRELCVRLGLDPSRITYLQRYDTFDCCGIRIEAVPCDHGELAPYAVGILLSFPGKKVYITGDTAFRSDIFENPALHDADLLILPINGMFGNMNESEAASAARLLTPKITIPCHFWNFAEHGGNPSLFIRYMKETAPDIPFTLMRIGEILLI